MKFLNLKKIGTYILAGLFLFLIWDLGAGLLNKPFLPSPYNVFLKCLDILKMGSLNNHFYVSTYRVVVSIILAFILATPLGLILGRVKSLDRFISPLVYILYPLPKVVFLPIIVVILGLGNLPKIFLITLIIFFQILVTARDASKSVPLLSIKSMKSLNASPIQVYYHLIWPYSLPKVLTALRISLGTAIAVLFFAETFASTNGLGYFILDAMERREYETMYVGIIAMGGLGLFLYLLVDMIEHFCCRWQKF